ncbi:MAG: hypothetical protein M3014_04075 [Chloroflexota bacterium]|nr:hypothetical protein [Chloroflexota bacterium]
MWEIISSAGRGRLPNSKNSARLVRRKSDKVLVVEFTTYSGDKSYVTLEEMTLYPPDVITYRHLSGPIPHVWEEIRLERDGKHMCVLLYRGKFRTASLRGLVLSPFYIKPLFDKLAREHLLEIKVAAESRAMRSLKYPPQEIK